MFTRLAVLFFFSGASALVYQVLWLRQLSLIFGVTIYAASTPRRPTRSPRCWQRSSPASRWAVCSRRRS